MSNRHVTHRKLLALGFSILSVAGCKSSEHNYAPVQPISGLDQPHPEDQNPHDADARDLAAMHGGGPTLDSLLDPFVDAVAARTNGARIAVFPALGTVSSATVVNGLGEYLTEETARRLTAAGASVLSGEALVTEISAWNRPPETIGSLEDIEAIAAWVQFDYVILGTVNKVVLDTRTNAAQLEFDWQCQSMRQGRSVAHLSGSPLREGRLAQDFVLRLKRRGSGTWNVNQPTTLSLDVEIGLQARLLARRLCAKAGERLDRSGGAARVSISPTILPGEIQAVRALQNFSKAFEEARQAALRDPSVREAVNQDDAVMGRPCVILGRSYSSFRAAQEAFASQQGDFETTQAGVLARLLSDKIGVAFESECDMQRVPDDSDTLSLIKLINAQASSDFIDRGTVPFVLAQGAQLFVESRIEKDLDGRYVFSVKLTNVDGDYWTVSDRLELADYFTDLLTQRLQ